MEGESKNGQKKPQTRLRWVDKPGVESASGRIGAQESLQQVRGQGAAEQVALVEVAACAGQQIALFGGFHALGDHFQAQAARQGDDGVHNRGVVGVGEQVAHKALVDLELVERHAF